MEMPKTATEPKTQPTTTAKPVVAGKRVTKQPADWTKGAEQTILLTPVPNLKFNLSTVTVRAGTKVKLTFNNTDDMLHNVVIVTPNSADDVGSSAMNIGLPGRKIKFCT